MSTLAYAIQVSQFALPGTPPLILDARETTSAVLREHLRRPEAPTLCDPDDFDAHVAGTADDGAPIYGSCSTRCTVL